MVVKLRTGFKNSLSFAIVLANIACWVVLFVALDVHFGWWTKVWEENGSSSARMLLYILPLMLFSTIKTLGEMRVVSP